MPHPFLIKAISLTAVVEAIKLQIGGNHYLEPSIGVWLQHPFVIAIASFRTAAMHFYTLLQQNL